MKISINYRNTGFDKVSFKGNLLSLEKLCRKGLITDVNELNGGFLNKVFRIEFEKGSAVLKVSPLWSNNGLLRESWCINQILNRTSIRVPRVLAYASKENRIFPGHELLIIEFIPGRLLEQSDFNKLSVNEKISMFYHQIHSIPMEGFGWLTNEFIGMHSTWTTFLKNIDNIELNLRKHLISPEEVKWLLKELVNICTSEFQPCLLHGDFKWTNFIVNNSDIIPIDFQNCFAGHPLYDIGIGLFFHPQISPYLSRYINAEEDFRITVLYGMRHAISVMGHRISVNDREGIQEAKERYGELKRIYSKIV